MVLKRYLQMVFIPFFALLTTYGANALERDLPEELRALAVICSSSADISYRGSIEGGINKLFGKIVAGSGDFIKDRDANDFLNDFDDENLKIEARKIYIDCVENTLSYVYGFNQNTNVAADQPSSRILVPDGTVAVKPGQKFALRVNMTMPLSEGGFFSVIDFTYGGEIPIATISHKNNSLRTTMTLGNSISINKHNCFVTYYSLRNESDEQFIYSFQYDCN